MKEIWKDVVGYEGLYEVSNLGQIRSVDRTMEVRRGNDVYTLHLPGKILKQQIRQHGYLCVWLYGKDHIANRNGKCFSVHRIVAEAFLDNPNNFQEVNHIDENKQNNRLYNLEWCSHKENSNHGTRGKRIGEANKNGTRSKAVCQFSLDGNLIARFESIHEADRQTGISYKSIWNVLSGRDKTAHGYVWKYA